MQRGENPHKLRMPPEVALLTRQFFMTPCDAFLNSKPAEFISNASTSGSKSKVGTTSDVTVQGGELFPS